MQITPVLPDYNAPSSIKQFLEDRGKAMQKKFGQNFLIFFASKIIASSRVSVTSYLISLAVSTISAIRGEIFF